MEKISNEGQLMILGILMCIIAAVIVSFYIDSPPLMIGIGMLAAFIIQKLRKSREERISESENE